MVIAYQETVKEPLQPFGLEITARYARYQRVGLEFNLVRRYAKSIKEDLRSSQNSK